MNLYLTALMDAPPLTPGWCVSCGETHQTEKHHPVRRSQGGANGPVLELCRDCHWEAHNQRLHFRYRDGWQHAFTEPMKYETALAGGQWWDCCGS